MVETTIGTSQLGSPILAEIRDYAEMHAVMRERAETLEVSRATIDHVAGLENGYAAKLLQPKPSKQLGPVSWSMLRVLGIKLLAVVDVEACAALAHRAAIRSTRETARR